jgi:hypothetical protein
LSVNETSVAVGDVLSGLSNSGLAPVMAVVVSSEGGQILKRESGDWVARLPAYSDGISPPRAAFRVNAVGWTDVLEPHEADFRFGAVFNLDVVSQGSEADNGDNLMQRGLYGDEAQYKLQLDGRVPMCRVRGDEGAVVAKGEPVQPLQWYRARCYRSGSEVTLRTWTMTQEGALLPRETVTVSGAIGSLDFEGPIPMSVGGKLDASGQSLRSSGDQFNGSIDQIVYDDEN